MKALDKGNGLWVNWRFESLAWPGRFYQFGGRGWEVYEFHMAPFVVLTLTRILD